MARPPSRPRTHRGETEARRNDTLQRSTRTRGKEGEKKMNLDRESEEMDEKERNTRETSTLSHRDPTSLLLAVPRHPCRAAKRTSAGCLALLSSKHLQLT